MKVWFVYLRIPFSTSDICGIAAEEGASLLDIRSADIVSFTSSFYKLDLHALISRSFVVAFPSCYV